MANEDVARKLQELGLDLARLQHRLRELEAVVAASGVPEQSQAKAEAVASSIQSPRAAETRKQPPSAPAPYAVAADLPATPPPLPPSATMVLPPVRPYVAPSAPKPALEQFLGMKAMLVLGVAVLLLGGAFFFKYAVDQGWITPLRRTIMGGAWGLVMVGLGEWAFRRNMRYFAAGLFGAGIVWWYATVFNASPNGFFAEHKIFNSQTAFMLMCLVTAAGVGLAARSGFRIAGIIALVGAIATPALLSTGENRLVLLMAYLLAVNAGFLLLAAIKRWEELSLIALVGTVGLIASWGGRHYTPEQWGTAAAFSWAQFALFAAWATLASHLRRVSNSAAIAIVCIAAVAMAALFVVAEIADTVFFCHLLALELAVLGICRARNWSALRLGVLAWTAGAMTLQAAGSAVLDAAGGHVTWAIWIWLFYFPLLVDVLARLPRGKEVLEAADCVQAVAATGAMFASTYWLLNGGFHAWMGPYTGALGAAAIAAAFAMWQLRRAALGDSFLAMALALLALAVPIQFDKAPVTLAWIVQGVLAMYLYRRLRKALLLVASLALLGLAVWQYAAVEAPNDPVMAETLFAVGGVAVPYLLALAIVLAGALLLSAGLLAGAPDRKKAADFLPLVIILCLAATVLYLIEANRLLPRLAATWWWLVPAATLGAIAIGARRRGVALWCLAVLGLAAAKHVMVDTHDSLSAARASILVAANWQFAAGLILAALFLAAVLPAVRQRANLPKELPVFCGIAGTLLVVWTGSAEVYRYFCLSPASSSFANASLAFQMGLSIWWALCAGAILAVGFAGNSVAARYLAMILFALTLGKVFLIDMREVLAVYRILSFLALGTLMVIGSWLYHRHFRA